MSRIRSLQQKSAVDGLECLEVAQVAIWDENPVSGVENGSDGHF